MNIIYDNLDLREFYRAGFEVTPENSTKFDSYPLKGLTKHKQTFQEFFINDQSLSETISKYCELSEPLTLNWVGTFGFHFTKEIEKIKVNQLLLEPTSEKQIIESYPQGLDKKHLKHYLMNYKNELAENDVFIYVCGECGDVGCGGIYIRITKYEDYYEWTYKNDEDELSSKEQTLTFKFEKKQYLKTLDDYINKK